MTVGFILSIFICKLIHNYKESWDEMNWEATNVWPTSGENLRTDGEITDSETSD
jgi:hypothetical protein